MFGKMSAIPVLDLRAAPQEIGRSLEAAVARLLDVTEHPAITKWVQFPRALFLFLVVPGDAESGAFYVYDRHSRVWFWVDFEDEKFGGYNVGDFERLVRECRFFNLVERPSVLRGPGNWLVQPGTAPSSCPDPEERCECRRSGSPGREAIPGAQRG